jgi:hypothetical protein
VAYALEVSPAGTPPAPTPWLPDQVKVMESGGGTNVSSANSSLRYHRGRIEYLLPKTTKVTIRLFSIKGSLIATITDARQESGCYSISLPAKAHAAGQYVLGFKAGEVENFLVVQAGF